MRLSASEKVSMMARRRSDLSGSEAVVRSDQSASGKPSRPAVGSSFATTRARMAPTTSARSCERSLPFSNCSKMTART